MDSPTLSYEVVYGARTGGEEMRQESRPSLALAVAHGTYIARREGDWVDLWHGSRWLGTVYPSGHADWGPHLTSEEREAVQG